MLKTMELADMTDGLRSVTTLCGVGTDAILSHNFRQSTVFDMRTGRFISEPDFGLVMLSRLYLGNSQQRHRAAIHILNR